MSQKVSVLFVCLGNICRSPTAHGIFEKLVEQNDLQDQIEIDSAGTGDWHIGKSPDGRAQSYAQKRGYDLSHLRARQISPSDFADFDYILAMDEQNLADIQQMQPEGYSGHISLFWIFWKAGKKDKRDKKCQTPIMGEIRVLNWFWTWSSRQVAIFWITLWPGTSTPITEIQRDPV